MPIQESYKKKEKTYPSSNDWFSINTPCRHFFYPATCKLIVSLHGFMCFKLLCSYKTGLQSFNGRKRLFLNSRTPQEERILSIYLVNFSPYRNFSAPANFARKSILWLLPFYGFGELYTTRWSDDISRHGETLYGKLMKNKIKLTKIQTVEIQVEGGV